MLSEELLFLARTVWEYHHMNHTIKKSDCILVLGSHDTRVAERGAELYLEGWAPLLIFSGGLGRLTSDIWKETEADKFAAIATKMGVPQNAILVENKSTNTGENILFTRKLLQQRNLHPQSFIVVQKPYMERRSYATFKKVWPEKDIIATSPQLSFDDYPTVDLPLEKIIHIMVGDLQRIHLYPELNFQIAQDIPEKVWDAYEQLVKAGFSEQLIKSGG
jgi:uncharacterized SAM-binding protein YcdF (DUF218 family)